MDRRKVLQLADKWFDKAGERLSAQREQEAGPAFGVYDLAQQQDALDKLPEKDHDKFNDETQNIVAIFDDSRVMSVMSPNEKVYYSEFPYKERPRALTTPFSVTNPRPRPSWVDWAGGPEEWLGRLDGAGGLIPKWKVHSQESVFVRELKRLIKQKRTELSDIRTIMRQKRQEANAEMARLRDQFDDLVDASKAVISDNTRDRQRKGDLRLEARVSRTRADSVRGEVEALEHHLPFLLPVLGVFGSSVGIFTDPRSQMKGDDLNRFVYEYTEAYIKNALASPPSPVRNDQALQSAMNALAAVLVDHTLRAERRVGPGGMGAQFVATLRQTKEDIIETIVSRFRQHSERAKKQAEDIESHMQRLPDSGALGEGPARWIINVAEGQDHSLYSLLTAFQRCEQ